MQPLPNQVAPIANSDLTIKSPWNSYLQQFTQAPAAAITNVVSVSPYIFVAREPGNLIISGGTISSISFKRGSVTIDLTGQRIIPVSISDSVTIAYSFMPSVQFLPLYGAAPK